MGNQKYDAFLKVAETGSFKQAAHDLGYTQAGISYLVSTLERELDVPLFVRDYGGVHTSPRTAPICFPGCRTCATASASWRCASPSSSTSKAASCA